MSDLHEDLLNCSPEEKRIELIDRLAAITGQLSLAAVYTSGGSMRSMFAGRVKPPQQEDVTLYEDLRLCLSVQSDRDYTMVTVRTSDKPRWSNIYTLCANPPEVPAKDTVPVLVPAMNEDTAATDAALLDMLTRAEFSASMAQAALEGFQRDGAPGIFAPWDDLDATPDAFSDAAGRP